MEKKIEKIKEHAKVGLKRNMQAFFREWAYIFERPKDLEKYKEEEFTKRVSWKTREHKQTEQRRI